ncbi:hypothetical protein FO519_007560 [Halicephalobus sp. NKZ332]|nr:hypothetical protein FO519_007560 [Halicephalobus sp. NKZ332]
MGIRDKGQHGLRNGGIHTSEQSLPEKLTQALKALRPGVLSQSSSGSSPFVSKSGVVDADDVIYYTSANRFPTRESSSQDKKTTKGKIFSNQRKSKSVFAKHSSPSQNDISAQFNHGVLLNEVKSLDQIRHLYKSVPNVSSFEEEPQTPIMSHRVLQETSNGESPQSSSASPRNPPMYLRHSNQKLLNPDNYVTATSSSVSSLGTSQSPTDSGYRSNSRYLVEPKPPPLPSNPPPLSPIEHQHHFSSRKTSRSEKEVPEKPSASSSADYSHGGGLQSLIKEEKIYSSSPINLNSFLETDKRISESVNEICIKKFNIDQEEQETSEILPVKLPIDERDVLTVIQRGRCKQQGLLITIGVVKNLTNLMTVPLLRICTEGSRLAKPLAKCTMNNIRYATMLCLPEFVAEECIKTAVQATTLYALSGTGALRISMSRRSGLNFSVGNFYRWMIDTRIASIITETTAIYLAAVMECLLEKLLSAISDEIGKSVTVTEENFDRLMTPHADVCQFLQFYESKIFKKSQKKLRNIVCAQSEAELRTILDHLYRKIHSSSTLLDQNSRRSKNALYFGKQAISSLFYFTRCKGRLCSCHDPDSNNKTPLYDWLRFILYFVDHRFGMHVDQQDVLQAARLLLPNVDCPPYPVDLVVVSPSVPGNITDSKKRRQDIAFTLLLSAENDFANEAFQLLGPLKHKATNDYGLTSLAQAVITRNEDATSFLISNNVDVNLAIPADNTSHSSALSSEFSGWTPLSWAIANQDAFIVGKLLEACADVDEVYMVHETPLQLAVMIGDADIFSRLISCGANSFSSTMNYDSLNANFRSTGSPCALAVAAAFGRRKFMNIMLSQSTLSTSSNQDLSLTDFLSEGNEVHRRRGSSGETTSEDSKFRKLPKVIQRASQEAIYYAVEASRSDIAMDLRKLGVPWNIYTWTRSLQTAYDAGDRPTMMSILHDFNTRLSDELSIEVVDDTIVILFDIIRYESRQSDGTPEPVAQIISLLNEKFTKDCPDISDSVSQTNPSTQESASTIMTSSKPMINAKYADNAELSDIRFKIDDKIIYAHRIILVNASDEFKRLLDNPSGIIELDNVSYEVFKVLIDHMYGNRTQSHERMVSEGLIFQLEAMEASLTFGLDQLAQECYDLIKSETNNENCIRIYRFAQRCGIQSLINDSELYILQNIGSLIHNDQLRIMLQRSGQPGWCDICAALASRLVEAFESFTARQNLKRHC